jgi:D-alanyl-D-alanine dipeptidase
VGAAVDGYLAPKCILAEKAARAVARVQADLSKLGLRLRIYDCYRPQQAVDHFVRWAKDPALTQTKERYYPNVPKGKLFKRGYIASRSGHSRGSTVDLTIDQLDMGTGWDFLDPLSHTANPKMSLQVRANRLLLKSLMEKQGFRNYSKEWWHYSLRKEAHPSTFFNFPVK